MLQRDWLMRQIEQAGRILGAILARLRSGQTADVLGLFDQAYRPLLGVGAAALPYLSDEQLLDLLRPGGSADDPRWPVLAQLLAVEADVHERRGARVEALARWRRAMLLLNQLGGDPQREPGLAAEVAGRLRAHRLRPATRVEVARLYEGAGRYADAEDTYFEGLDFEGPDEPGTGAPEAWPDGQELLLEQAIEFYRRLMALSDEALEAGELPREEVHAALAELLARPVTAVADPQPGGAVERPGGQPGAAHHPGPAGRPGLDRGPDPTSLRSDADPP